jgi:hypothetical protein
MAKEKSVGDKCPDCQAKVGELHKSNCDVERCSFCGGQALQCFYENSHDELECECRRKLVTDTDRIPWDGEWPGKKECQEYNFWSKMVKGRGWVRCEKDDPEASEDLNRLHADCEWDVKKKRFVLRK